MTSIRPMTPVSLNQSGSGSDGGAMAALTPGAVNLAKFGVLTRFGQTGDWPVNPGQVSRRHGPAGRSTSTRWSRSAKENVGIPASSGLHFACALTPGRTSTGRCVRTVSLNPARRSS